MTAENDFLTFAAASNANVLTQSQYAALSALGSGFSAGIAQSAAVNKALRQSSIMAAVIASFIVSETGQPAIDDGTTATLLQNFTAAIAALAASMVKSQLLTQTTTTTTASVTFNFTPPANGNILINAQGGASGAGTKTTIALTGFAASAAMNNFTSDGTLSVFTAQGSVVGGTEYSVTVTQTAGAGVTLNNLAAEFVYLPS